MESYHTLIAVFVPRREAWRAFAENEYRTGDKLAHNRMMLDCSDGVRYLGIEASAISGKSRGYRWDSYQFEGCTEEQYTSTRSGHTHVETVKASLKPDPAYDPDMEEGPHVHQAEYSVSDMAYYILWSDGTREVLTEEEVDRRNLRWEVKQADAMQPSNRRQFNKPDARTGAARYRQEYPSRFADEAAKAMAQKIDENLIREMKRVMEAQSVPQKGRMVVPMPKALREKLLKKQA